MASSLAVSGHLRSHSPQSYKHSGSRCTSERRHPIQKVVHSLERHPSGLCEGNPVRVFSRSSGKWVHGKITKIEDNSLVRVEYEFKDDTYGKNMHVDSDHLIIPCQLVDPDLTSNKYQYDLRAPTSEVEQQPEQWGKNCPKASGLNSHGCLTPSESEYSEKDPEIGFFDNFKNPFCSGPWKVSGDRGRLSEVDGNREWIVTSRQPADVKKREKAAKDTLRACEQGYIFVGRPDSGVKLKRSVDLMVTATSVIKELPFSLDNGIGSSKCPFYSHTGNPNTVGEAARRRRRQCPIYWTTGDPIDVAEEARARRDPESRDSNLVALVTEVSANCGGFLTGGIPNLEESLCMRTTLFQSLQKEFDATGHISAKGVVLSPGVNIFRGSYAEGYPFWDADEVISLHAVLSVAMPDRSGNLTGAGTQRQNEQKYHRTLEEKMAIMLKAAAESACNELVIPEIGRGYCANDRWDVGFALGRTLAASLIIGTRVNRVTLVGDQVSNQDFADGVLAGGQFERPNTPWTGQDGEPMLLATVMDHRFRPGGEFF